MDYTPYKLKHWIKQDKIEWKLISLNPRAIDIINDKILSGDNYLNWNGLSMNPNGAISCSSISCCSSIIVIRISLSVNSLKYV